MSNKEKGKDKKTYYQTSHKNSNSDQNHFYEKYNPLFMFTKFIQKISERKNG